MLRPYRSYARLAVRQAEERPGLWLALRRPLRWLLIIGAFVSLSSAGRLVLIHVVASALFWAFLPALQALAVTLATALVARGTSKSRAIDLYFAGQAPWLLLLVGLAGLCLFAPRVYPAFTALLGSGALPGLLLATIAWSTFLTWVFWRRGLSLGRIRSALGMLALYAVYGGALVGYFFATNQIQPLLAGRA